LQSDERYSRQIRFSRVGEEGQARITASRIAIIGAGALGSVSAELLVRAGAGFVRIVDRDFVEGSNLQRQSLYDEEDVRLNLPKAAAAAAKLRRINSSVLVEPIIDDVNPSNVEEYIRDVDLVLDGLDNFETRFVLNDACAKQGRKLDSRRSSWKLWRCYAHHAGEHSMSALHVGQPACPRFLADV
jgi:adenylyltransferase/sulfurtransferase